MKPVTEPVDKPQYALSVTEPTYNYVRGVGWIPVSVGEINVDCEWVSFGHTVYEYPITCQGIYALVNNGNHVDVRNLRPGDIIPFGSYIEVIKTVKIIATSDGDYDGDFTVDRMWKDKRIPHRWDLKIGYYGVYEGVIRRL